MPLYAPSTEGQRRAKKLAAAGNVHHLGSVRYD